MYSSQLRISPISNLMRASGNAFRVSCSRIAPSTSSPITIPSLLISHRSAVDAAQRNTNTSKQKRVKIIKARIPQPDEVPVVKVSTPIDLKNLTTIPKNVMAPFLSGHFTIDSMSRHAVHHAIITKDLARLQQLITDLHDHVNAIAHKLQAENAFPDLPHRDSILAADSSPAKPSLAFKYVISLRDTDGLCPLVHCYPHNQLAEARVLVEAGADIEGVYNVGIPLTPVMVACNMGLTDICMMLLERGVNAEIMLEDKCLLYLAVVNNNATVVRWLLERGVSPAAADEAQGYALVNAAVYMGNTEIVKAFLDYYCKQMNGEYVPVDFSKGEGVCDVVLKEEVRKEEDLTEDEAKEMDAAAAEAKESEMKEKTAEDDDGEEIIEKLVLVQKSPMIPDLSSMCDLNGMLMIALDRGDDAMGELLARYGAMMEYDEDELELDGITLPEKK